VLGGSRLEISTVDCRKRQTSTATPAKPGELPYGLGLLALVAETLSRLPTQAFGLVVAPTPVARRAKVGVAVFINDNRVTGHSERKW
jgi:hypothetical protein